MEKSRISVLIRTKNSSKTLDRCIKSIYAQSISVSEIIVVDSGSEDNTIEIAQLNSVTVIFYPIEQYSFNYSKALNIGIEKCKTDLILILSSHVWFPISNILELMQDTLISDSSIKAVSMGRNENPIIEEINSKTVQSIFINMKCFKGTAMYNYCSLIRKSDWEEYKFNEAIPTCEDQDWMLHWMKKLNSASVIIQNPVVGYTNPFYNLKKDVQEYFINGKYIYPYFNSFRFLFDLYIKVILYLFKRNLNKSIYYFSLATILLKYKIFPPENIVSDLFMPKNIFKK